MRILLAEDDHDMAKGVAALLERNHYAVEITDNGEDALYCLKSGDFDAAILDIMMPGLTGTEALSAARKAGCTIPVLLLTAMGEVEDRIEGLDAGADDYLAKPFDGGELLARVRALLRRSESYTPDILKTGDLVLDRSSYRLSCGENTVSLNNKSFQVMEMLLVNCGRILSVNRIMEHVWGWDSEAEINVVWVNLSQLRKQLQRLGSSMQIRAVRGAGYTLEEAHD